MNASSRTLTSNGQKILVRIAQPDELVDLRHRILRQGLPREAAIFDGDHAPTTLHIGAFCNGKNIGCATFHLNEYDGAPAWQLRGMATDDAMRGAGIGRSMLELSESVLLQSSPLRKLWCNARTPALGFYKKLGWQIVSDEFFIETAGPHFRMTKQL